MPMQQLSPGGGQSAPDIPINENFQTLEHQSVYGPRQPAHSGLTWAYYGGRWGGFAVADGTLTLTNAAVNRVVVDRVDGAVSTSTNDTNWNNRGRYARVYRLTTAGSVVTAIEDHRAGPYGVHGGGGIALISGAGTPESAVVAPVGTLYTRTDGGAGTTLYVKESGTGNTGWVAK